MSHHDCSENSCHTHGGGYHHHHGQCHSHGPAEKEEKCDMPEKMLALADEAWREAVKCKMKAEIEASCGEQLTQLAKMVVEANKAKWGAKIAQKAKCHEFEENLYKFFSGGGCNK